MYKIIFSETASRDLGEINSYISKDSPLYANKVVDKIILTISNLSVFPFLGKSDSDDNLREISEPRYGFRIIYQIIGKAIYILAIFKYKDGWK
ncbi:MAG: type II toxin-antitoxin system RelE/ParE family toxin [Candidatus Gracilibacteria bacterium]